MQENRIRIDFGWKSFLSIFWLKAAGADLQKVLKKIYLWKSTNFMFICKSRPWKCKRTAFESILAEKVSFHFLAQGRRRGPAKSSEKNIFWKSTNFMFICKSSPSKCKWTELESILVEKVSFHFLAQGHRRGPVKKSEKIYFENPPILCSIATAGPENAREQNSNRFWLKKFPFSFGLKAAGADLRKVLKKIYFENPQILFSFAKAGPENAIEQHSNRFWLNKFHFIFWPQAAGADLWKNMKKICFENPPILCSIATAGPENAREQSSNRFWLKKFHFIFWHQGCRRGPAKSVKKSEKNIFWNSTNIMFNSNSRPWKCKRTEFGSILVEKVSFHFLAQGRRRGPAKSS